MPHPTTPDAAIARGVRPRFWRKLNQIILTLCYQDAMPGPFVGHSLATGGMAHKLQNTKRVHKDTGMCACIATQITITMIVIIIILLLLVNVIIVIIVIGA